MLEKCCEILFALRLDRWKRRRFPIQTASDSSKRVNDGDASAFEKSGENFSKKAFAKGKKLKTRLVDRSPRSAFSPNTAARTVPDWRRIPCCASLATRRPRPQKADVRGSEPEKRDAVGVDVAVKIESTDGRSGTLAGTRANVVFIIALLRILSTGGEETAARRGVCESRRVG